MSNVELFTPIVRTALCAHIIANSVKWNGVELVTIWLIVILLLWKKRRETFLSVNMLWQSTHRSETIRVQTGQYILRVRVNVFLVTEKFCLPLEAIVEHNLKVENKTNEKTKKESQVESSRNIKSEAANRQLFAMLSKGVRCTLQRRF